MSEVGNVLGSIGYFDEPGQAVPAYDPGPDGMCPVCQQTIGEERRLCRSLMVSSRRSYFFSYHERCKDEAKLETIENAVVDELFDWDEAVR